MKWRTKELSESIFGEKRDGILKRKSDPNCAKEESVDCGVQKDNK
jgi:hypothetical protein